MSSSTPPPVLRPCFLYDGHDPPKPYLCLNDEICCKNGCCSAYHYKYFQTWYFWYYFRYLLLALLVAFLVYRYICYKCKNEDQGVRMYREEPSYNEMANALNPQYINHLIVSYQNLDNLPPLPLHVKSDNNPEPPPMYSVAVNLPKPSDQEIPTYEEAVASVPNTQTPESQDDNQQQTKNV